MAGLEALVLAGAPGSTGCGPSSENLMRAVRASLGQSGWVSSRVSPRLSSNSPTRNAASLTTKLGRPGPPAESRWRSTFTEAAYRGAG